MYPYVVKAWIIGIVTTIFISWVASGEIDKDKAYLSKDLAQKRYFKRSVRAESSSESEENVDDKAKEEKRGIVEKVRESESDEADSSDSDGDRRLSTKGLVPDDFEPERNPRIHERYSKDSESE